MLYQCVHRVGLRSNCVNLLLASKPVHCVHVEYDEEKHILSNMYIGGSYNIAKHTHEINVGTLAV